MNDLNTPESLCDRARRLAHEAEAKRLGKRAEEECAFLESILGADGMRAAPFHDESKTYTICGWRWSLYQIADQYYLALAFHPANLVRRQTPIGHTVITLEGLGEALIALDKEAAAIRAKYPETLWGDFRAWWDSWTIWSIIP